MKRIGLIAEIILLVMVVALAGCGTVQEKVVTKTETKLIKTPQSLLVPCAVKAPPSKTEYVTLDYQQKEAVLVTYSLDLLTNLRMCNGQISKIKEFQDKEVLNLGAK